MYNRIIVASDAFKGSLSSMEVAEAVEEGIHRVFPDCRVVKLDMADGGEGTMQALRRTLGGETVRIEVADPLGRPVIASYLILENGTAVLEMAQASGLTLLRPEERNPLETSTYGTGQLVADALKRGCRRFLVGIGGSATNDAGMGMLEALGVRFYDRSGLLLPGKGESLGKVADIRMDGICEGLLESDYTVACDVDAPFFGPKGAACVFAPQKGADEKMVEQLDKVLRHFSGVIETLLGKDVFALPGAGAAGGLGGCFVAFLSARLERGAEMVLDAMDFDGIISSADLVITGEGRIDSQTLGGKTPYGVMLRAGKMGIPVIAIGGSVALDPEAARKAGFKGVFAVTPEGMPLSEAMQKKTAMKNVSDTVERILKEIPRS